LKYISRIRLIVPGMIAALTIVAVPGAAPAGLAAGANPITFSRETVADPVRLSFEPSVAVGPHGTIYESPIFGFRTTQSFIQRSDDGGQTFNVLGLPGVGKVSHCTGGGDSDISTTPTDDLYMIDLGDAPEVPAHVSHDHGASFSSSCLANLTSGATNVFADRQWLSTDTVHNYEWYIYRDGLLEPGTGFDVIDNHTYGEWIFHAPLATAPGTAGDPQLNFTSLCQDQLGNPASCLTDINVVGGAVTDNYGPHKGVTYLPVGNSPTSNENDVSVIVINPDAPTKVRERTVARNTSPVLFATVAVDRASNLYFAWVDSKTLALNFAYSTNQGVTWSAPRRLNAPQFETAVMPWLVAGDDGRVDLVFYGTPTKKAPPENFGPWSGWMMQTLHGHDANPNFSATPFTDRPMHLDPICLSGIDCYTQPGTVGDRELGDFFKVMIDRDGRALISFDDGNNQLGNETPGLSPFPAPSFASFVRQAEGPGLYAAVGNVPPVPRPTNSVSRGAHPNPVPFTLPTGGSGADVPALNLLGSSTKYTPTGLKVKLKVKNLDPTSAVLPPALPTATYLTRWFYKGAIYYAAAEYSAALGWKFFSGQVAPVLTSNNVGYAYYPNAGPATGSIKTGTDGTITIDVNRADVGNPPSGATLYSATSYAFTHALPSAPVPPAFANFTDLPQIADVMPAYNVEAATSTTTPPGVTPGPSAGPGSDSNLPNTGTSPAAALAALLVLAACLAVVALPRRRGQP
jgi:hypothetical protein